MQVEDAGFFSRGKVRLPASPDITPDAVMSDLGGSFGAKGYEVYKTALIGADLVLKRSAWTGLAIKIKHTGSETLVMFNPFAPSALVRILFMGLIPILYLYFTSWKEMREEFMQYASGSRLYQR